MLTRPWTAIPNSLVVNVDENPFLAYTVMPAYSDTAYSDTPLIVTLWAGPNSSINRVTGYSDTNICLQ